jgi:serine/threonine protein kinase
VGKFHPVVFGDYILFHALAQGGMAEVYLARKKDSAISTDRLVVIKKIISESVTDVEFKELFKQEVSISMSLSHANIIQTYDYGIADGEYYLVMEYVPGRNLSTFMRLFRDRKEVLPLEFSCFVIQEVCNALSYTQSFRDPISGEYRSLVHRDISPQNILVGQSGSVRLLDFGIAKMQDHKGITRTGQIRGKASYLSPEQALQKDLDARSDIFALGIVFWELLTNRKLFNGETDSDCINLLLREDIPPPSSFNELVPKELDAIVMKSLERDIYKRYQLAQEFHRDVHFYLQSKYPGYGPGETQIFVNDNLSMELNKEEETIRARFHLKPEDEIVDSGGFGDLPERTSLDIKFDSAVPVIEEQWKKNYKHKSSPRKNTRTLNKFNAPERDKESESTFLPLAKIFALFIVALLGYQFFYPKASGHQKVMKWKDQLIVAYAQWQSAQSTAKKIPSPNRQLSEEDEAPIFADPNKTTYELSTNKIGFIIYVDGVYADLLSNSFQVPKNKEVRIRAELPGHETIEWIHNPKDKPWKELSFVKSTEKGVLYFSTTPDSDLKIYQGDLLVLTAQSPIEGYALAPGTYRIVIENSLIGHLSEAKVTIEKSKTTRFTKALQK